MCAVCEGVHARVSMCCIMLPATAMVRSAPMLGDAEGAQLQLGSDRELPSLPSSVQPKTLTVGTVFGSSVSSVPCGTDIERIHAHALGGARATILLIHGTRFQRGPLFWS